MREKSKKQLPLMNPTTQHKTFYFCLNSFFRLYYAINPGIWGHILIIDYIMTNKTIAHKKC
jgi:hypothetical protein